MCIELRLMEKFVFIIKFLNSIAKLINLKNAMKKTYFQFNFNSLTTTI